MDQISGHIERITFQNEENGYTVAHLQQPGVKDLVCIVGRLPQLKPGETIRAHGSWKTHLTYGKQFIVEEYKVETPSDVVGIRKYLGSGLIKGIGPKWAEKIVDHFGADTLNVIEAEPEQLLQIEGFGKKKLELVKACWQEQRSIRDVMVFLQSVGVTPAYAQKIFKMYGEKSIQKVKANPYELARDVHGIGFKIADAIAQKLGIGVESNERIDAGIEFSLYQLVNDGHVCYPLTEFIPYTAELLGVSEGNILPRIHFLNGQERIVLFDQQQGNEAITFIWSSLLFNAETSIAREIKRVCTGKSDLRAVDIPKALDWVQKQLNIELAQSQQTAVSKSLSEKMGIITGGPGTGKSTITNAILTILSKLTDRILLAAPTGRAAKRMSEITNRKAQTIHSLLEFDYKGGFKRKKDNPLECDLLIVDEASMIDTFLMSHLMKAIPTQARVVFVGDINQLPSVGPGNVLKDLITSNCMPVTRLNEIFRQAAGSKIIQSAHRINQGIIPDIKNTNDGDFFFLPVKEPEDVLKEIVSLACTRLPKKFGFKPLQDIQVLSPMRKGVIGTENLNIVLQEALNPKGATPTHGQGRKFLTGDKVMQIKNNYKKGVFNGDIGIILEISPSDQELVVQMEDKEVVYEFSELDELVLAYAVSIHKYQGSECPCIIIPVHTTHFKLLFRNLLYTGVTRGKKLVVLVGTTKALFIAVNNDEVRNRHTGLRQALECTIKKPF